MSEYAVQMMNISKYFGSQAANDHVDFTLRSGTIHGLLGENGAGKTTLMNVLFGLQNADEGKILVFGEELALEHSPKEGMRRGIGMVHQHFKLVRTMTVTENFLLGLKISRYPLLNPRVVKKRILQLSGDFTLNIDPDAKIGNLSVGEQQRVEILSALYRDASVLILDEPTAVLTPEEAQEFFVILKALRKAGKSIILISHHLDEIIQIADEVTVLKNGKVAGTAKIDASVRKEDLSRMMVGRDVLFDFDTQRKLCGEDKLVVQNLCAKNERGLVALKDLSFAVRRGEILAIAGVDGNGQKELCEVLVGLRKSTQGSFQLEGKDLTGKSPACIIANHVSYIPEDRQTAGLVMSWSIRDNLILKMFRSKAVSGALFLHKKKIDTVAEDLSKAYAIKSQGLDTEVKNLSGGNQQKVILARELSQGPSLLVASNPTRGLDIGAMEYVRQQMLDVRNAGGAVLLVSADLEEIFQIADRILVMYGGRSMGIVMPQEGVEIVGQMMAGICNKELYV